MSMTTPGPSTDYQQAVKHILNNDFAAARRIDHELITNSMEKVLIQARFLLHRRQFESAEQLLQSVPAVFRNEKVEGDYHFLLGRVRHALFLPSEKIFRRAFSSYLQAGDITSSLRALLNSTLDILEEEKFDQALNVVEEGAALAHRHQAHGALGNLTMHRSRIHMARGSYQKAHREIQNLAEGDFWQCQTRRTRAILWLYAIECQLNRGGLPEAERLIGEAANYAGESDINETIRYHQWRYQTQMTDQPLSPSFNPSLCLRTFQERALFFYDLAHDLELNLPKDREMQLWHSLPPPEFKVLLSPLTWNSKSGELFNKSRKIVLKTRLRSQSYRLLQLLTRGEQSKWELTENLFPDTESQEGEQKLFNLISRINRKVPGLVHCHQSNYRLLIETRNHEN